MVLTYCGCDVDAEQAVAPNLEKGGQPVRARSFFALVVLFVLVLGVMPPLLRSAPTDTSWLLYLAEWTTRGGTYGRDFIEVSPPLILWLSLPPTLVAKWIATPVWPVLVIWCALFAATGLILTARALAENLAPAHSKVLLVAAAFAMLMLPLDDFSQREHIALLTTIPYLFLGAARAMGARPSSPLALCIGVFAGIGFGLKPYFLVPLLLVELYLWRHLGNRTFRRIEPWAVVLFGVVYLVLVVIITPGYIEMARQLRPWYGAYLDTGVLNTLHFAGPVLLLSLLGWAAHVVVRKADDPLSTSLALTAIGFLLATLIQGKGFPYHFLPARGFALLALVRCWQVVPLPLSWRPSGLLTRASVGLLVWMPVAAGCSVARELAGGARVDPDHDILMPVLEAAGPNEPVAVLSTNPASSWPLLSDAGVRSTFRYPSLWPLAAVYHTQLALDSDRLVEPHKPGAQPELESTFVNQTIVDLENERPTLILVLLPDSTAHTWGGARRIDYLDYFGRNPRFAAFMDGYQDLGIRGTYRIFRRRE